MKKYLCLFFVLLLAAGCSVGNFFAKGYRVCAGYLGATICLDKPNGNTNGISQTNITKEKQ